MKQRLTARLSMVTDMVPECGTVADIGTDHAYVPIALLESGRVKRALLCDINRGPAMRAQKNAEEAGLSSCTEVIVADGLSALEGREADAVIIAGMGGETISGILGSSDFAKREDVSFILQPMTCIRELRQFLRDSGYVIEKEEMCLDSGKYYTAMLVKRGVCDYGAGELFWGRPGEKRDVYRAFVKETLKKLGDIKKCMEKSDGAKLSPEYEQLNKNIEYGEKLLSSEV